MMHTRRTSVKRKMTSGKFSNVGDTLASDPQPPTKKFKRILQPCDNSDDEIGSHRPVISNKGSSERLDVSVISSDKSIVAEGAKKPLTETRARLSGVAAVRRKTCGMCNNHSATSTSGANKQNNCDKHSKLKRPSIQDDNLFQPDRMKGNTKTSATNTITSNKNKMESKSVREFQERSRRSVGIIALDTPHSKSAADRVAQNNKQPLKSPNHQPSSILSAQNKKDMKKDVTTFTLGSIIKNSGEKQCKTSEINGKSKSTRGETEKLKYLSVLELAEKNNDLDIVMKIPQGPSGCGKSASNVGEVKKMLGSQMGGSNTPDRRSLKHRRQSVSGENETSERNSNHPSKSKDFTSVTAKLQNPSRILNKQNSSKTSVTHQNQSIKEMGEAHNNKSKCPSITHEKSQQPAKLTEESKKGARNSDKSLAELVVVTTNHDQVSKERFIGPSERSNHNSISEKSQVILKPTGEPKNTPEGNLKKGAPATSSHNQKSKELLATNRPNGVTDIVADNISQLMDKYELMTSSCGISKASSERKNDKKLSQKKMRNMFGDDHLVEDSERIYKTPFLGFPDSVASSVQAENLQRIIGDASSLHSTDDISGRKSSQLSRDGSTSKEKITNLVHESSLKKQKLSDPTHKKSVEQSRRHSVDITCEKTTKYSSSRSSRGSVDHIEFRTSSKDFQSSLCNKLVSAKSAVVPTVSPQSSPVPCGPGALSSTSDVQNTISICERELLQRQKLLKPGESVVDKHKSVLNSRVQEESIKARIDLEKGIDKASGIEGNSLQLAQSSSVSVGNELNLQEEVTKSSQPENSTYRDDDDCIVVDEYLSIKTEDGELHRTKNVNILKNVPRRSTHHENTSKENENLPSTSSRSMIAREMSYVDGSQSVGSHRKEPLEGGEGNRKMDKEDSNIEVFCLDEKFWDDVEKLEAEYKKKEEDFQRIKAEKEKLFKVLEQLCGIEVLKKDDVKKEPGLDDIHQVHTPVQGTQEVHSCRDIKDECDRASSVSTEILELSDDFQAHQSDNHNVTPDNTVSGLVSSSGNVCSTSACPQKDVQTGTSGNDEMHTEVSSSAVQSSSTAPVGNNSNEVQLGVGRESVSSRNTDVLTQGDVFRSQESRNAQCEGNYSASETSAPGTGSSGVVTKPREDRIRVRVRDDLLAEPSHSQNSHTVSETGNPNDPDRIVRECFMGEESLNAFKEIQRFLAASVVMFVDMMEATNTPQHTTLRCNLFNMLSENCVHISKLILRVFNDFRYKEHPCFSNFLFLQLSLLLPSHTGRYTLEQFNGLISSTFKHFQNRVNPAYIETVQRRITCLLQMMGVNTDNHQAIVPLVESSSGYIFGDNTSNNNVVVSSTRASQIQMNHPPVPVSGVTNHRIPAVNPDSSTEMAPASVVSASQIRSGSHFPGQQLNAKSHNGSMESGVQERFAAQHEVSSASNGRINSTLLNVNHNHPQFQLQSLHNARGVPSVTVNPQHQTHLPFPSVANQPQANHPRGVETVVGGQLPTNRGVLPNHNSVPTQNLVNYGQSFQNSGGPRYPGSQFVNQVNGSPPTSLLQQHLQNPEYRIVALHQSTATYSNHGHTAVTGQSSTVPAGSHPQKQRPYPSHQFSQNQPRPQDQPFSMAVDGSPNSPQPLSSHSQRTFVSASLHRSTSMMMPQTSRLTASHHPPSMEHQVQPHHSIPQGQAASGESVFHGHNNSLGPHNPPPSYLSHFNSYNRNASGVHSGMRQGQERLNNQHVVCNVQQTTTLLQNQNRVELVPCRRNSTGGIVHWNPAMAQTPSHSGESSHAGHTVSHSGTNHGLMQSHRSQMVPNIVGNSQYGEQCQYLNTPSRQGSSAGSLQQNENRPSIIQAVPRVGNGLVNCENSSVLGVSASPHQLPSSGITLQSSPPFVPLQQSSENGAHSYNPNSALPYAENVVAGTSRQNMLLSVTSPTHSNSPSLPAEESDQPTKKTACNAPAMPKPLAFHSSRQQESISKPLKKRLTSSMEVHLTKARGQGVGRSVSRDSGYRSPSQGTDNNTRDYTSTGVCYSCHSEAVLTCSRCRSIFYCSAGCQAKDWRRHKTDCKSST